MAGALAGTITQVRGTQCSRMAFLCSLAYVTYDVPPPGVGVSAKPSLCFPPRPWCKCQALFLCLGACPVQAMVSVPSLFPMPYGLAHTLPRPYEIPTLNWLLPPNKCQPTSRCSVPWHLPCPGSSVPS